MSEELRQVDVEIAAAEQKLAELKAQRHLLSSKGTSWVGLPPLVRRLRKRREHRSSEAPGVPTFTSSHPDLDKLEFAYLAFPKEVEYTLEEIFVRASYHPEGMVVPDGGVVFDAGANQGIFSVFAAGLAENVRVFSFEPIPDIWRVLASNCDLYNVQGLAFNAGLSHESGRAQFTYYPGLSVLSGQYADAEKDRETMLAYDKFANPDRDEARRDKLANQAVMGVPVDCALYTMSDVIDTYGVAEVHLLKVDVEKAELDVLRGIQPRHWKCIHHVVVEAQQESRIKEVIELLRTNGLNIAKVERDPACEDMALIYARNPDPLPAPPADDLIKQLAAARIEGNPPAELSPPSPKKEAATEFKLGTALAGGKLVAGGLATQWPDGSYTFHVGEFPEPEDWEPTPEFCEAWADFNQRHIDKMVAKAKGGLQDAPRG